MEGEHLGDFNDVRLAESKHTGGREGGREGGNNFINKNYKFCIDQSQGYQNKMLH